MIHRLDLAARQVDRRRRGPAPADLDRRRRGRSPSSCSSCCATTGCCGATPTSRWPSVSSCCCCRCCRASARSIYGSRIWIQLGPLNFQPGEFAKIALAIFFAGYLVQTRDALSLAGRKVLGFTFPRGRDLGPILVAWLASLPSSSSSRTSARRCCSSASSSRCSTSPPSGSRWIAIGLLLFAAGAYLAYLVFGHVQQRVDALARPLLPRQPRASDQLAKGLMGHGVGRALRHRARRRAARPHLLRRESTSSSRASVRSSACSASSPSWCSTLLFVRARPPHRARRARRLRQAARRRPVLLGRAPVLRRHRRRHPGHPADRPDHAVPVARAARRCSRTGRWSPSCCASPTTPAARCPRPTAAASAVGRGPHRGGEAAVNAPVRRLSLVVAVLFASLLVSTDARSSTSSPPTSTRARDNRRTLLSTLRPRARRDPRGGQTPSRSRCPSTTSTSSSGSTTSRGSTPTSPASTRSSARPAASSRPRTPCSPASSDKLFYRRVTDLFTGRRAQGANLETDPRPQGAGGRGRRRSGHQGRRRRARPEDRAPSSPWSATRPTTPTTSPATTWRWSSALQGAQRRPRQADAQPHASTSSTRPGRCSRWSRPRRPLDDRASTTENSMLPGPAVLDLPDDHGRPAQPRRPSACGAERRDHADRRARRSRATPPSPTLGLQLGADALQSQAAKFGFGDAPRRADAGRRRAACPADLEQAAARRSPSIGQYDVQVTPLQMAMVAAGIANGGAVMKPYLVQSVIGADLASSSRPTRRSCRRPCSPRSPPS